MGVGVEGEVGGPAGVRLQRPSGHASQNFVVVKATPIRLPWRLLVEVGLAACWMLSYIINKARVGP